MSARNMQMPRIFYTMLTLKKTPDAGYCQLSTDFSAVFANSIVLNTFA